MDNLVLITAALRLDNLIPICNWLNRVIPKKSNYLIEWLICIDKYNSYGNRERVENYIKNNFRYQYFIKESGKPYQKNYGGDMFNDPLKYYIENCTNYNEDPWVYILDDDNLMNPMLFDFFNKVSLDKKLSNKRCMWLTLQRSTGPVSETFKDDAFMTIPKLNIIPIMFNPDPSQIIMKYSLIKDMGMFGNTSRYDFDWLTPNLMNHLHEIIFYNDIDGFCKDRIHSYWNGLRSLKDMDEALEDINDPNSITSQNFYLESSNLNHKPNVFPIKNETALKILKLIKEDMIDDM